jgi:hypothetical protein
MPRNKVLMCVSTGRLSKEMLPPKQLSQTLHNIERQLPGNYTLVKSLEKHFRGQSYKTFFSRNLWIFVIS